VSWIGRTLGNYRIEAEIAQGEMARVYRAYQPQLERRVAIKTLRVDHNDAVTFLERFRREAKAIAALRHPNILTIYDYGEEEGTAYIVMEYIAAGCLSHVMTGQPRPWAEVAVFILPICQALAYAHSKGIIHCDVKPGNILLATPDWPILADFGLFQLLHGRDEYLNPGTFAGTPAYVSPEQIMGQALSQSSDIYSLGLVLYELTTGHPPFQGVAGSMMMQRLHTTPPMPSLFNYQMTPELEAIILRALARKPEDRQPDMEDLLANLLQIPGAQLNQNFLTPTFGDSGSTKSLSNKTLVPGPHLVVMGTGTQLYLGGKQSAVIGRSDPRQQEALDLDLSSCGGVEAGVSRRHARLRQTAAGWILEDLNSTNGTLVNARRIDPGAPQLLSHGDIVRCGLLTLLFQEE
jgi:eukaryotic-like serine/threonine-protein kinase